MPSGQDQRVVRDRSQLGQRWIGSTKQRPQVVVLPEEGVEAAAHGALTMIIERPGSDPSSELIFPLNEDNRDAALGQTSGGGKSGDTTADHDHTRWHLLGGWTHRTLVGRVAYGPAVYARHPACLTVDQEAT